MKKNILWGILFGLLLTVAMLAIAVWSTAQSSSFYLSQNDKYDIIAASDLAGVDAYIRAYGFITDAVAGSPCESATVSFLWGTGELFFPSQLQGFCLQGRLLLAAIIFSLLLSVACPIFNFIYVKKLEAQGENARLAYFDFGLSAFITAFAIALGVNIFIMFAEPNIFAPAQTGFSAILFSPEFFADFAQGAVRFFDFLMLVPLFISYVFMRGRKMDHPNDDYLYQ